MENEKEELHLDILKCYVKEYKKTKITQKIPLCIFYPEVTESIYITDDYSTRMIVVRNERQQKEKYKGMFSFKLSNSNTEIAEWIYTYAISKEVRDYERESA